MTPHQRLSDLEAALDEAGYGGSPFRDLARRIRNTVERFAALEIRLLEAVWIPVPSHLIQERLPGDDLETAEVLAERERERLGLPSGAAGNVMEILDREGLKVYRTPFPRGSLEGIFLFDPEAGPALVADAALAPPGRNRVFARLYGHYLLDHDPYAIRFAETKSSADPIALRAEAFAAAWLVDREGLLAYLAASDAGPGTSRMRPGILSELASFFEVDPRTVLARLLALGRIEPGEIPDLLEGVDPDAGEVSWSNDSRIAERMMRLALEAHARDYLTLEQLATILEATEEEAERLASRFRLEPPGDPRSNDGD